MNPLIKINGLNYSRNNHVIFSGIDLEVKKGNIVAIMGPSGSGKTTLLRLISGQLPPDQGEILVQNKNINQLKQSDLFKLRRNMGMLFQSGGLFTHLDVFENVAFPLREHTTLSEKMLRILVLLKLEMVGLRGAHSLMPTELSGGMARRVALARAIALDPELILYDEPFAGQDPISMGVLISLIETLNKNLGITSVIVSHDVSETFSISNFIYLISNASIIGAGSPEKLINNPSDGIQQFLKGLPDGPVAFHYPAPDIWQDFTKGVVHE